MAELSKQCLQFGSFTIDVSQARLWSNSQEIALRPKAFELLFYLATHPQRLLTKDELLGAVWSGVIVTEDSLTGCVSELRAALGEAGRDLIRTVPRRGYCLDASVARGDGLPWASRSEKARQAAVPCLYGREAELRELASRVVGHRVVTVVGEGGIGKTRLAAAVARAVATNWAEGARFVELASLADPAHVYVAVAHGLGVALAGRAPALHELAEHLQGKSMLLVLDNAEHVLGAVCELIEVLSACSPHLHFLTTSQERVRVTEEQVYRLDTLAVPPVANLSLAASAGAVQLFVERAKALDSTFELTNDTVAAVVDICAQLDGLPLAIEMAAAHVPTLGLGELRNQLHERFHLLTSAGRRALLRHQSLLRTFEWSHGLLSEPEQVLYRRLGIFCGGFSLSMAQAVASDDNLPAAAVLVQLCALVDRSMVTFDKRRRRYQLLVSAKSFALSRLASSGELGRLRRRHAWVFAEWFEAEERAMIAGLVSVDERMARAALELDNLRAAIAWAKEPDGDAEAAASLVVWSAQVMKHHGCALESVRWIKELEPTASTLPPALIARYWIVLGAYLPRGTVPSHQRIEWLQRGESFLRSEDDPVALGYCLYFLSHLLARAGEQKRAAECLEEAFGLSRRLPAPLLAAAVRLRRGVLMALDGQLAAARSVYSDALALFAAAGDTRSHFALQVEMADLLLTCGEVDASVRHLQELLAIGRERFGGTNVMALISVNLLRGLLLQGKHLEAHNAARDTVLFLRRSAVGIRAGADALAWLAAIDARPAEAAQLVGVGDAWEVHSGERRRANDELARDAALSVVEASCGSSEGQAWRQRGRGLDLVDIQRLVDTVVVDALRVPASELQGKNLSVNR